VTGAPVHDTPPRLRAVGRWLPGADEIAANPRARSAVLRVAERV
jgi:16S rRNA (cytosine1402-N4)-methyltransferase